MAVFADINTYSVLLAGFPVPDVLLTVCPNETILSFAFIIYKVALILLAVSPSQNALPVHLIL
jgi:hypothetical protein